MNFKFNKWFYFFLLCYLKHQRENENFFFFVEKLLGKFREKFSGGNKYNLKFVYAIIINLTYHSSICYQNYQFTFFHLLPLSIYHSSICYQNQFTTLSFVFYLLRKSSIYHFPFATIINLQLFFHLLPKS